VRCPGGVYSGSQRACSQGVDEAAKKSGVYENRQIDQIYADKLSSVMDDIAQGYKETGKVDPQYLASFNKWKGDPNTLGDRLTAIAEKQKIPMDLRDKLLAIGQAEPTMKDAIETYYKQIKSVTGQ